MFVSGVLVRVGEMWPYDNNLAAQGPPGPTGLARRQALMDNR
jgi:hypothetical protein